MAKKAKLLPSDKQLDLLGYIVNYVQEHGFQPSQVEMAAHFGVSKTAVVGRLKELVERNLIALPVPGRERAIVLNGIRFKAVPDEKYWEGAKNSENSLDGRGQ